MRVYHYGEDLDVGLLRLWSDVSAAGEVESTFGFTAQSLAVFMTLFKPPSWLAYDADEHGWWIVSWCSPFLGAGSWGLWVRPDKRASGSREGLQHIVESLNMCFESYPTLVNVTKDATVVDKTCALGYTYVGTIPTLWDGKDAHVMAMTRDEFREHAKKWNRLWATPK